MESRKPDKNEEVCVNWQLAADADFAEAEHYTPAVRRTPKAELRAETRKHQHLVQLTFDGSIAVAGEYPE